METVDDILRDYLYDPINFDALVKEQEKQVKEFCERYGVTLLAVETTTEQGRTEPLYVFNDCLGGYSIDGILKSLEE